MPTFHRRCQSWVASSVHSVVNSCSNRFGDPGLYMPSRLPFPRGDLILAAILVFVRISTVEMGCSLISLLGMANSCCCFLESFAAFAPFQQSFFMAFSTCVAFWFLWFDCVGGSIMRFNFVIPLFSQFAALCFIVAIFATAKQFPFWFGSFFVSGGATSIEFRGMRAVSSGAPRPLRCISLSRCRTMS